MNLLFLCSMNKWRSPTAERVFARRGGCATRSAGLSQKARRRVRLDDLRWADMVFVMEHKHLARLRAEFRQDMTHLPAHVLDIPDEYRFMDPELVSLLEQTVAPMLDKMTKEQAP